MKTLRMAWRQLLRDVAAGDIRILFAALVLAVVAVTAVGFVTDRAERALAIEANRLLGGDVVVRGDAPITGKISDAANATGLRRAETLSLNSMIRSGEQLRLGDLRALGEGFPLRGSFRIIDQPGAAEHDAAGIPQHGDTPSAARHGGRMRTFQAMLAVPFPRCAQGAVSPFGISL